MATIPLLLAFTNIPFGGEHYQLLKIITLLSVGIVQASLMHYFWQDPKEAGKAKIAFATDGDSHLDHERSTRLQERDRSNSQWDISDDQALQSEA